jgi:hypothetical protein
MTTTAESYFEVKILSNSHPRDCCVVASPHALVCKAHVGARFKVENGASRTVNEMRVESRTKPPQSCSQKDPKPTEAHPL